MSTFYLHKFPQTVGILEEFRHCCVQQISLQNISRRKSLCLNFRGFGEDNVDIFCATNTPTVKSTLKKFVEKGGHF